MGEMKNLPYPHLFFLLGPDTVWKLHKKSWFNKTKSSSSILYTYFCLISVPLLYKIKSEHQCKLNFCPMSVVGDTVETADHFVSGWCSILSCQAYIDCLVACHECIVLFIRSGETVKLSLIYKWLLETVGQNWWYLCITALCGLFVVHILSLSPFGHLCVSYYAHIFEGFTAMLVCGRPGFCWFDSPNTEENYGFFFLIWVC